MAEFVDLTNEDNSEEKSWLHARKKRRKSSEQVPQIVLDLTQAEDCDDLTEVCQSNGALDSSKRAGPSIIHEEEAPFQHLKGDKRVQAELKHTLRLVQRGELPCSHLQPDDVDARVWHFELNNFDTDSKGGKRLTEDLRKLQHDHGIGSIQMEARFPADYPSQPFSLRVVRPRMQWYTGMLLQPV